MAFESWPTGLPAPRGLSGGMTNGQADPDMLINNQRRRTYPEHELPVSVRLTSAQLATFRAWYEDDLNEGQALWTAGWLATNARFSFHRIRIINPIGLVMIKKGAWELTMNLEIIAGVPTGDGGAIEYYLPEAE